jgi:outer membrane protein assembly factor BamB
MSHRAALPLILTTLVSLAADWPEFRGPTGQGHARDVDLPVEWSETENLVW